MGNCCDSPGEKYTPRNQGNGKITPEHQESLRRIHELETANKKFQAAFQDAGTEKKRIHELETANKKLHTALQDAGTEKNRLNEAIKRLNKETISKEVFEQKVQKLEKEIKTLADENDVLKTRLSGALGAMITDGNSAVADLSDLNRPTNLATQYTELYDNEWTDAFEYLTTTEHMTEPQAVTTLRNIFCEIYQTCQKKADDDMNSLNRLIVAFFGGEHKEIRKRFKDSRRAIFQKGIQEIEPKIKVAIKKLLPNEQTMKANVVAKFIDESLKIAWLMVVQDPPVFVDVNINRDGQKFDAVAFRPYTKSGALIEYVVWPVVYLAKGEGMLAKGIAQGCSQIDPPKIEQKLDKTPKTATFVSTVVHSGQSKGKSINNTVTGTTIRQGDTSSQQPLKTEPVQMREPSKTQHRTTSNGSQQHEPVGASQPLRISHDINASQRQQNTGTNQPQLVSISAWKQKTLDTNTTQYMTSSSTTNF